MTSQKYSFGNSVQNLLNSQLAIRQEIQRFESVHPSIYAIYDLIELIPDSTLSQSIRDHVVSIEGMLQYILRLNFIDRTSKHDICSLPKMVFKKI